MIKIAIVEDDIYLREEIITTFTKKGYSAAGISSFAAPEQEIIAHQPDLVVLDINLPGKSGFELCRWLKSRADFPILILTARDTLDDELTALGLGADDFLTKPCHPDRLLARSGRLLQTYGKVKNIIQADTLFLDTDTYKLVWKDKYIILPDREGKILQLLMVRHPSLVSQNQILAEVWSTDEFVDENILQVNMTRLRKSLSEIGLGDAVKTVRGQGYHLGVTDR